MGKKNLSRRTVLKGAGVALALPLLDIMESATAFAQTANTAKYFFFLYFPNGTYGKGYNGTYNMVDPFDPIGTGVNYQLPEILAALQPYRTNLTLFRGLQNNITLDSPGSVNPHAMGSGGILTCSASNPGATVKTGISMDQLIAAQIGAQTKLPYVNILNPAQTNTGDVAAQFWNNSSWSTTSRPTPSVSNPQELFDRLFTGSTGQPMVDVEAEKRRFYKQSVLDSAKESINRLLAGVGVADKAKLDEHFTSIRAIELKLQQEASATQPVVTCNGGTRPASAFSGGSQLTEWIDTMVDISIMALRCDLTRVITLNMDQEGSTRNMSFMGAVGQSHDISHHLENSKTEELKKVNAYFVARFKRALDGLKGSGSNQNLLNTGLTMFTTPFSNGNYHNASNIPMILAGNGNGSLQTDMGHVFQNWLPLANLHLRVMRMYGMTQASFGNSTGVLNI